MNLYQRLPYGLLALSQSLRITSAAWKKPFGWWLQHKYHIWNKLAFSEMYGYGTSLLRNTEFVIAFYIILAGSLIITGNVRDII